MKGASGAGLLVGAPYAGLGLANFGKVDKRNEYLLIFSARSITSTQAQNCHLVTSALSVSEHQPPVLAGQVQSNDFPGSHSFGGKPMTANYIHYTYKYSICALEKVGKLRVDSPRGGEHVRQEHRQQQVQQRRGKCPVNIKAYYC